MFAIVDDGDFDVVSRFKWHAHKSGTKYYAMTDLGTDGKRTMLYMHKLILYPTPRGREIDHVNGNGLDNRKENMRFASRQQNSMNRPPPRNNTSGFKGVGWHKKSSKWKAAASVGGKTIHLGLFGSKAEAADAYNRYVSSRFQNFAFLN